MGPSKHTDTTFMHCAGITWSLATIRRDDQDHTWGPPKWNLFLAQSQHMVPKMHEYIVVRWNIQPHDELFLISAMNAQVCIGFCLRVSPFRMGRVSPDALCRMYGRLSLLLALSTVAAQWGHSGQNPWWWKQNLVQTCQSAFKHINNVFIPHSVGTLFRKAS